MIQLRNADVVLAVDPVRGGGITAFRWRGIDLFRPAIAGDTSPTALSSFVLVPWSNRIEDARFDWQGRRFAVARNLPGSNHALHGTGWMSPWSIVSASADRLVLAHDHDGADWPSSYRATQQFELLPNGYRHHLGLVNTGRFAMPAGLGFHPYFPRPQALLRAAFDGMWETSDDGLPVRWTRLAAPPDWFGGATIDAVFTGRQGPIRLDWPGHGLTIQPCAGLDFTTIYCPAGEDFFCVEPVSHMTNALNHPGTVASGQRTLDRGESWSVSVDFRV